MYTVYSKYLYPKPNFCFISLYGSRFQHTMLSEIGKSSNAQIDLRMNTCQSKLVCMYQVRTLKNPNFGMFCPTTSCFRDTRLSKIRNEKFLDHLVHLYQNRRVTRKWLMVDRNRLKFETRDASIAYMGSLWCCGVQDYCGANSLHLYQNCPTAWKKAYHSAKRHSKTYEAHSALRRLRAFLLQLWHLQYFEFLFKYNETSCERLFAQITVLDTC